MYQWNTKENFVSFNGSLTTYSQDYDGELSDVIVQFDVSPSKYEECMNIIRETYDNLLDSVTGEENEEHSLIALNSNSFKKDQRRHNIFMEWDEKSGLPDIEGLKLFDGTITETKNGLHFLKEANLPWPELKEIQKQWGCCEGFMAYSDMREVSSLRICPKGDNKLKIIHREDGFLHSIYEELVKKLGEE